MLQDDVDPMVSVMKLEKAPKETYADIGGLDAQIQEIKVCGAFDRVGLHPLLPSIVINIYEKAFIPINVFFLSSFF